MFSLCTHRLAEDAWFHRVDREDCGQTDWMVADAKLSVMCVFLKGRPRLFFVAVFHGYNQYLPGGFMALCVWGGGISRNTDKIGLLGSVV